MHYAITPGSSEWLGGLFFSIAFILLPPYLLKNKTDDIKIGTGKAIGAMILLMIMVFWGLPGAFHSIITPELTHGFSPFLYAEYYIAHAGIFAMAVFASAVYGMKLRKHSWFRVWLFTQPVLALVGLTNYLTGGNYMYLSEKPIADNPFVIGEWPWYILGLELAGLLHFGAVYGIFYLCKKVEINPPASAESTAP
jgi:uncharacterized membrane protein YwaF